MKEKEIKILIVDDDIMHLKLFVEYVKLFNAVCQKVKLVSITHNKPEEVIENGLYKDVDILMTDYYMPKINGDILIQKIKEDKNHKIKVFIGASSASEINKQVFDSDYFIEKRYVVNLVIFTKKFREIMGETFYKKNKELPC